MVGEQTSYSIGRYSILPTHWRRQSLNRTDAKVPEGVVCTGTKGVAFVLAPRTLCTGAKRPNGGRGHM